MTYSQTPPTDRFVRGDTRRASPIGAYVAAVGTVVFLVSVFVDWLNSDGEGVTGYELDSLIPFIAYLGVGLALAMLYAAKRATRRQHRGLSLTSMAAGLAAAGFALSYLIDVPGSVERGTGWDDDLGVWLGLIGGLLWAVGSYLIAKDAEGDIEHDWRDHTVPIGSDYDRSRGADIHAGDAGRVRGDTRTDAGRGGSGN